MPVVVEKAVDPVVIARPDKRIPALDGLRAVASLMVVFYHYGPHVVRSTTSTFSFLHKLPEMIWQGVDLFFVLSGFLIASILLEVKTSPNYFRTFYIRRIFRLFPLYYLILGAYVATVAILGDRTKELGRLFESPLNSVWYFLYLQNFAMGLAGTFGPIWLAGTWSLAVEEQFYFTLPLMIRKFSERTMWWVAGGGFIMALLVRAVIMKFRFINPLTAYMLLPARVDSLAAGVLVAMLVRYRYDWVLQKERLIRWAAVGLAIAAMVYEYLPNPQAIRLHFVLFSVWAIVFAAILLAVLVSPSLPISRFLSLSWMRELGNMAYSTYLFHPIILCVVFRIWRGYDPKLDTPGDLLPITVALAASLMLSWFSWRLFERKMLAIGHRSKY